MSSSSGSFTGRIFLYASLLPVMKELLQQVRINVGYGATAPSEPKLRLKDVKELILSAAAARPMKLAAVIKALNRHAQRETCAFSVLRLLRVAT